MAAIMDENNSADKQKLLTHQEATVETLQGLTALKICL